MSQNTLSHLWATTFYAMQLKERKKEHSSDYLTYDSAYVARLISPAQGATQQQKSGLCKKGKKKEIVNLHPLMSRWDVME